MKKSILDVVSLLGIVMVASCNIKTYELPVDYKGSVATIRDTTTHDKANSFKAQIYTVHEINGVLDTNSPHRFVSGAGPGVVTQESSRKIPTKETILTLSGREVYGADGFALMDWTKRKPVSGDIFFTPKANRVYEVRGSLGKKRSSIWLVDTVTNRVVGRKISN